MALSRKTIKDPFLRQAFSFHPLLIGGNPFDTPSIYTLIVQFEKQWGVHYALGGTGAVVQVAWGSCLPSRAAPPGSTAKVTEILVHNRRVTGVRLADGTVEKADVVVCNGDVAYTYRHLIPAAHRRKYSNRRLDWLRYSNSLFVIYFGTKRRYLDSQLQHHNIIIHGQYRQMMREIFGKNQLPNDLGLYLHMPSLTDPGIAPPGCESFYVLSLVPNLGADVDWTETAVPYRNRIMEFLEANITCPTCKPTSSPSITSTRCTSSTPSTATGAPPSPSSPPCCNPPGCGRTTARKSSTICTLSARAPTPARASRPCSRRARLPPN
jgi:phytoene desaturase